MAVAAAIWSAGMAMSQQLSAGTTTLGATGAAVVRREGDVPAEIGRYKVLKAIGAGGMGVVYAAYDTDLDRKVAIKLLHQHGSTGPETAGHTRLLREAQAMAKISHPNVLQVFEAGTHAGQVFLALEFVEGCTLEAWLTGTPHPWPEVVEMFLQAGRGLQAAHEAGLIHRDFKPENVLVDRTGRARVMDFGLARQAGPAVPVPEDVQIQGTHSSQLSVELTLTGAVMGTPLYMAPEQHAGAPTDARTDEFAFCVALYEAVYGQRPFAGDDLRTLAGNVMRGLVREPPRERKVPGWLRRAVLRGLSSAPEDRYPSMQPLLAELARDHGAARRWTLLAVAAAALVIAGAWGFAAVQADDDQRCRGGEALLAETWGPERAAAVASAFASSGRPYAAASAERVQGLLDARAAAWVGMYGAACESHARGEASADLYDLQVACLERRRSETEALVELLARADGEVVDKAVHATMALPPLAVCGDRAALLARVRPPEDPTLAAEVLRLRAQLDRAKAAQDAGKFKEGIALASAAVEAADASGHRPLIAEAQQRLGELHSRSNDFIGAEGPLWAALWAAEASRHDEVAAAVWTELVRVAGKLGQRAEAGRWAERAGAAVARLGDDVAAQGRLENELGTLAYIAEEHTEAVGRYHKALALRRAALGPEHPEVAATLANVGNALYGLDRFDEAMAAHHEALQLREQTLGPDHIDLAASLNNIGVMYKRTGRFDEAITALDRARQIWVNALGPANPTVLNAFINLGSLYYQQGQFDAAAEMFAEAVALAERNLPAEHPMRLSAYSNAGAVFLARGDLARAEDLLQKTLAGRIKSNGPDHPAVAGALDNLGAVAGEREDDETAAQLTTRALDIYERKSGPEHTDLIAVLGNLAYIEHSRGHIDRAEQHARRALAIADKSFGPESHQSLHPRLVLAMVLLDRRQLSAALAELDRIARVLPKSPLEPSAMAGYRFTRARVLLATGGDRDEAAKLAREARTHFEARKQRRKLAEVDAWLAAHKFNFQ